MPWKSHTFYATRILGAQEGSWGDGKTGQGRVATEARQGSRLVPAWSQEAGESPGRAAEAMWRASTGLRGTGKELACPAGEGEAQS